MAEPAEETEESAEAPAKGGRKGLLIGLVLALLGGGGGFYASYAGLLFGPAPEAKEVAEEAEEGPKLAEVTYLEVAPLTISLRAPSRARHLRFRASLEVAPEAAAEVEKLLPRVVDLLNGYLRALEPASFEDPAALTRLRAQMLRRVQVLAGLGKVRDLLVMEFVLN